MLIREPIDVIDARKITDPRDADELLAYFLRFTKEGDQLDYHGPWCRSQIGHGCSCHPRTLVVGARA